MSSAGHVYPRGGQDDNEFYISSNYDQDNKDFRNQDSFRRSDYTYHQCRCGAFSCNTNVETNKLTIYARLASNSRPTKPRLRWET